MIIQSISELQPVPYRAIIINVSTKEVSTLAVLSALRYSNCPILLIDLESTDGSLDHFEKLMASEPRLDICSASRAKHGYILDKIFRETKDQSILLIDSDLEIIDTTIVNRMIEAIEPPDVFGTGAIHGPEWMGSAHKMPDNLCLYQERMWIPFTMLKVAPIKDALERGYSFINRWVPNELTSLPWLAKLLSLRFFLPVVKNIRAEFLRGTRRTYPYGQPNLLCCDTGAELFCYLKYDRGSRFIDFGIDQITKMSHHYHGVTRRLLKKSDHNATAMNEIMDEVLRRLKDGYGIEF